MSTHPPVPTIPVRLFISSILAIMLLGGVMMMVRAVQELSVSRESRSWPTAPGKITRSEMDISTNRSESRSGTERTRTTSTFFEAKIEYEFVVDGVTHRGTRRTAIQDMNANRKHNEEVLRKYPVDQPVTVSYKPGDPSQCVLEAGSWRSFFIMTGISILFGGFSSGLLWFLWRMRAPGIPWKTPRQQTDQFSAPDFEST